MARPMPQSRHGSQSRQSGHFPHNGWGSCIDARSCADRDRVCRDRLVFGLGVGGFLAFGFLWLLGRLIYRGRVKAMARGDITIAAMVGAGAAGCTPQALFLGVLFGGLIAIALLVGRRSRNATMPYGPGLCLGGLAALFWC